MWYSSSVKKEECVMSDIKEFSIWIHYTAEGNVDMIIDHDK